MSQLEEARIDRLDKDAEAIEMHLYGAGASLLSKEQRTEMKAALANVYAEMASAVNRMILPAGNGR